MTKPITLTLEEKCYLVAIYGDLPFHVRARLFKVSTLPAQAGPAVIEAGREFVEQIRLARVQYGYLKGT